MSEELKPCPCCGSEEIAEGNDTEGNSAFTCEDCGLGTSWDATEVARAAWNRRASPTPHTTEGREKAMEDAQRIVAWDDDGRLADDEWLVERNETAIIAICRALLSSPRVEDVRRMREALEMFQTWWEQSLPRALIDAGFTGTIVGPKTQAMLDVVEAALSLPDGEGDKQARSPSALSAPASTFNDSTTK